MRLWGCLAVAGLVLSLGVAEVPEERISEPQVLVSSDYSFDMGYSERFETVSWASATIDWSVGSAAGSCLELVSKLTGDSNRTTPSAWIAWGLSKKGVGDRPTEVPTVLWFSHFGVYGPNDVYDNWGHVVVDVPGVGLVSSPVEGHGYEVFGSVADVEAAFDSDYAGWSLDIAGFPVSWLE